MTLSPHSFAALLLALVAAPTAGSQPERQETSSDAALADGTLVERRAINLEALDLGFLPEELARTLRSGLRLEAIVYASDGLRVDGYLARPRAEPEAPWPCVIVNRGGNRSFGALDDARAAFTLGPLALHGYVVVASQYRGNGPGLERYPPERTCAECGEPVGGRGREEFGGAEVDDVLGLIPLLESLAEADATRIGMFGWSRGGLMTYLALARTERIAAAVVGAGMPDLEAARGERADFEHVCADLIPGWSDSATRATALEDRSPVRWAERLPANTPILLLHGSADWRVAPQRSLDMARALLEARRPARLVLFEGGDHGLSEYRAEVRAQIDEWFDRYVRDRRRWPSLEPHGR